MKVKQKIILEAKKKKKMQNNAEEWDLTQHEIDRTIASKELSKAQFLDLYHLQIY